MELYNQPTQTGELVAVILRYVLSCEPASAQERRIALLIGNQSYDASVGALKNPHNDIVMVAESLRKQGFEVLPLIKDARRSVILQAVRQLASQLIVAGPGAIGFLYYSGHGAAERDTNMNYLIPIDARDPGTTTFWDESVKLDDVMKLLERAQGATKFVVFDACRNELQLPTRDTSKGLLPIAELQGFFVAYASAPGRTASDRGERSGPYAAALSAELQKPGLDHLNLFQHVKESVVGATGGAQQPWENNGLARRVYLTGEPPTPTETALWEGVRKSEDPQALQRFVDRYPRGEYASIARQMMGRLAAVQQRPAAGASEEVALWEGVRASGDSSAARRYLERYPNGVFADAARELANKPRADAPQRELSAVSEYAHWEGVRASSDAAALQGFLDRYPTGVFASTARQMVERLKSEAAQKGSQQAAVARPAPLVSAPPASADDLRRMREQADEVLVKNIQFELNRVGCGASSIDGIWSTRSQSALREFAKFSKAAMSTEEPTDEALEALKQRRGRVCPVDCDSSEKVVNGRCVSIVRPAPQKKLRVREAVLKSPPRRPSEEARRATPSRAEPRPAARAPEPAARKPTVCFGNGVGRGGGMGIVPCDDPRAIR